MGLRGFGLFERTEKNGRLFVRKPKRGIGLGFITMPIKKEVSRQFKKGLRKATRKVIKKSRTFLEPERMEISVEKALQQEKREFLKGKTKKERLKASKNF